ncbi:ABC transporter substrate-binding protein [Sinirhodobacter populi]|uniref:ABC transporter substrate-binding protein n=1 Tax=Paenirhodobacter populi TaxID=2306993 RepID=A0A443K4L3_9RHOB|nr:ABC transporter substrate-binding protein [Sinirhodobacter populi]RWR27690.1 ABC transporter substrate-binding protein [Sinirhodobacter populi]
MQRTPKIRTLLSGFALLAASHLPDGLWAQTSAPVDGGTLITVLEPEPTALVSVVNNNYPFAIVSANVFDGLLDYDDSFSPRPGLSTAWELAPDGLSITFHLREGVKWHDGRDFTSADVRYSALDAWKKHHPRGRSTLAALEDVETPDAHTAIFRLKSPSLVILSALSAAEAPVLPAHIYEGTEFLKNPANLAPIGTGPFAFSEWVKGQYITLTKNPDYWDKGKPHLDRVVFRSIPDAAARAVALETGEVQYAPFDAVSFSEVERLKALPELVVQTEGYDFQSQFWMLEFNLKRPVLADLRVRQAIAHAIDVTGLIDTVFYGLGKPATGPIPSSLARFYTGDVETYAYDPAAAERLLDEAGYPRGADGIRFVISNDFAANVATPALVAEYLRQNLKAVGIDLQVRGSDTASFYQRVNTDYDFDTQQGQYSAMIDPQMGLFRKLLSTNYLKGVPNMNASGYASPETDAIINAISGEADEAKRNAHIKDLQKATQRDLPFLSLIEVQHITVYSSRLHGVSRKPDAALSSFRDVWLKP